MGEAHEREVGEGGGPDGEEGVGVVLGYEEGGGSGKSTCFVREEEEEVEYWVSGFCVASVVAEVKVGYMQQAEQQHTAASR